MDATPSRRPLDDIRRRFPALVELYDNTASLQDRTVDTGVLKPALARQYAAGGYVGRASGRSFDARRNLAYPPYDSLALRGAGAERRRRQCAGLDPRARGRAEPLPDRPDPEPASRKARCGPTCRHRRRRGEGLAVVEGFRGDILVWLRLRDGRIERCHLRDPRGFSGRCSRPPSKATSSRIFRSATNRSTAPIPATISEGSHEMRKLLFQSLFRGPLTEAAPSPDDAALEELAAARSAARRGGGSAAACRSARSMPAPATDASWKFMRSTTPITTSSASVCASSPRRATPMCLW